MTIICKECDNDVFEEEADGFFYCQRCSVQADDIIGTAVAEEDFVGEGGDTRGAMYQPINTRRQPSNPMTPSQPRYTEENMRYSQFRSQMESRSQISQVNIEPADFGAKASSYKDYYDETRDRYINGFVMMITYQCDALVEKFNVTPLIIGLAGPICLRYVALSGVYDDDWADNAIQNSELHSEQGEAKKRQRDKAEPKNLNGKRAVMIWTSQLRKSLPLSSTLAISFLACHKAGAPILPTDLVRWAREGKIPFLSSFLKIQEQMGERSAACPVKASLMFKPIQIVSAQVLEARAAKIADIIGLPLPPVNFYAIASNYLNRLPLPKDKLLHLVSFIHKWSMPPELYISKNELRLPTRVCVMSIIIVATRMLYDINGFGVWELSLGSVNASGAGVDCEDPDSPIHEEELSEETSAAADSSDVPEATDFDTQELLKKFEAKYYEVTAVTHEYEKDLLSYLSHGKNEIFAGLKEASADDTYRTVDNLWSDYPKNEEFDRIGTLSKRGRDCKVFPPLNQLSLDDNNFSEEINLPSSPSKSSKSGSMDHDQCSSEHRISSPENCNQEGKSRETALERLITDMGENLFRYIPPRVKLKRLDYLQYVRKKEDGALIYAAHADYYILLRVCARVSEIDVRNMHRGVLSFERRLAWIEKRIDQVLHLTPPIMTCWHCDSGNVAEDGNVA